MQSKQMSNKCIHKKTKVQTEHFKETQIQTQRYAYLAKVDIYTFLTTSNILLNRSKCMKLQA